MDQQDAPTRAFEADATRTRESRHCHKRRLLLLIVATLVPSAFAQETTIIESADGESTETLNEITVEGILPVEVGPRKGLKLSKDQIPGNIQSATGEEIQESRATSLTDFMSQNMQSVNVNEYQGNPFQADVNYRGFTASPQIGTPQGLSVFFDGIRVNEPFGDIVNWDLIPLNAISTFDIFPGSNPLFGLNTLGGALSLRTKNGFDDPGATVSLLGGSWGRIQGQLSGGGTYGPLGGFVAMTGFHEDGWRDNSPSDVKQGFGKLTLRGDRFEFNGSVMLAGTDLLGNGLIPQQLYEQNSEAVFTSPDETRNTLRQFSLDGLFAVSNSFNITAQVYRRDSQRRAIGGDIWEDFQDLAGSGTSPRLKFRVVGSELTPLQDPITGLPTAPGPICRYPDVNGDGFVDYFTDLNLDGVADPGSVNADLQAIFARDRAILTQRLVDVGVRQPEKGPLTFGEFVDFEGPNGGLVQTVAALNGIPGLDCSTVVPIYGTKPRNGGTSSADPDNRTGIIEGTPIGVLTSNSIDQTTDGASIQFNWNLDKHVFMIGGSFDSSRADFSNSQRLALIDASHNVYADPLNIDDVFYAADNDVLINQFDGFSNTASAYFHETYSPFDNLHLTMAGRYNHTRAKTNLTTRRTANQNLGSFSQFLPSGVADIIVCPSLDPASCPTEPNSSFQGSQQALNPALNPFLLTGEGETFQYNSFNPSFGINFLPTENTNLYLNWSQGTRAPSVVELGCAYDRTPVWQVFDGTGLPTGEYVESPTIDPNTGLPSRPQRRSDTSIIGSCALPTTLSGDPFLPQIIARTTEAGLRGTLPNGWEWNAAIYRTNLIDDIYYVGITPTRNYFDTVGDTRRQGIELGLSGSAGQFDFSVNYGLNEATFQSDFWIISQHNNSKNLNPFGPTTPDGFSTLGLTHVTPGDRIPGMPLHSLNASVSYRATERWDIGLTMVAHSSSFVRGNENNDHQSGNPVLCADFDTQGNCLSTFQTANTYLPGQVPGYVLFNLKTSYAFDKKLTGFVQVNNLLDKDYASGGRLGIDPFTSGIEGVNGPSGWNYNSDEWRETTFIAPGSPRAFWLGLEYRF